MSDLSAEALYFGSSSNNLHSPQGSLTLVIYNDVEHTESNAEHQDIRATVIAQITRLLACSHRMAHHGLWHMKWNDKLVSKWRLVCFEASLTVKPRWQTEVTQIYLSTMITVS